MPISLRTRPVCHYCGKRNRPLNNNRFKCQHCLAENFIDEDGEPADVPPETTATPKQYARRIESPDVESPIFCTTCLKNQALYTAALSEFLPDPDDPEYDKYEAALPDFKERVEKQYPQCCVRCEPKVRAQLEQAMYNARSDHLRRVLEKSRARRVADRFGWRRLLVFMGGLGYFMSLATQLLWHAVGSQSVPSSLSEPSSRHCLQQWPIPEHCSDIFAQYLWISFSTGILCLWWNPCWQLRLEGRVERLTGLATYYRAQAALMAIRFAVWTMIDDVPSLVPHQQKLHSVALVLISICAGYSQTLVQIDKTPLVDWHHEPQPVLTRGQFEAPKVSTSSAGERFPVQEFASVGNELLSPWRPPTPPGDGDLMDWDPSPITLSPQPKAISYKTTQPTPFHGTLPQLPQGNIFARRELVKSSQPIGIPIGFFDKPQDKRTKKAEQQAQIAQPKFFPDHDRADTGLERIFSSVFSLHDDAVEVRDHSNLQSTSAAGHAHASRHLALSTGFGTTQLFAAASIAILGPMVICISAYSSFADLPAKTLSTLTAFTSIIPFVGTVLALIEQAQVSKVALGLLECSTLAILWMGQPTTNSLLMPLWTKLVIGTLSGLLAQAVYNFCAKRPAAIPSTQFSRNLSVEEILPPAPALTATEDDYLAVSATPQRRRRDSVSSIGSASSINTTSTASGWKTPVTNHRLELSTSSGPHTTRNNNNAFANNMGNLGINDFTFGSSVAGPRKRQAGSRH